MTEMVIAAEVRAQLLATLAYAVRSTREVTVSRQYIGNVVESGALNGDTKTGTSSTSDSDACGHNGVNSIETDTVDESFSPSFTEATAFNADKIESPGNDEG